MTLSAPTHLNRWNRRRFTRATHRGSARPARLREALVPRPLTEAAAPQSVLMVDLASPDGRTCWAVGGGDSLADALAFAQASCPADTTWQPVSWNELYGD